MMPHASWKKKNPCQVVSMKLLRKLHEVLQAAKVAGEYGIVAAEPLNKALADEDVQNWMKSMNSQTNLAAPRLSRESVPSMEAGPHLDRLVALYVMGRRIFPCVLPDALGGDFQLCPPDKPVHISNIEEPSPYSTDIGKAWLVFDHVKTIDSFVGFYYDHWRCDHRVNGKSVGAAADTAELAICRAALLPKVSEANP